MLGLMSRWSCVVLCVAAVVSAQAPAFSTSSPDVVAGVFSATSVESLSLPTTPASQAFAVDMDGDLDLDLLVSVDPTSPTYGGAALMWLENLQSDPTADALFSATRVTLLLGGENGPVGFLDVGDLDNDGDMDIVAVLRTSRLVVWMEQVEGGWAVGALPEPQDALTVQLGDLNADGFLDVVYSTAVSKGITLLMNTGGPPAANAADSATVGSRFAPRGLFTGFHIFERMILADVTGDGRLDIILTATAESVAGAAVMIPSVASADLFNLAGVVFLAPAGSNLLDIAVGDIDLDGKPDLVFTNFQAATISMFKGTGVGARYFENDPVHIAVGNPGQSGAPLRGAFEVTLADIDLDGALDLVLSAQLDNNVVWVRNNGGAFSDTLFGDGGGILGSSLPFASAVVAADFDRDGDIDVLGVGQGETRFIPNLMTISSPFRAVASGTPIATVFIIDTTAADVDGDGDMDLIVTYGNVVPTSPGLVTWEENLGSPTPGAAPVFAPHNLLGGSVPLTSRPVVGDLDGDGLNNDLVVPCVGHVLWFRNFVVDPTPRAIHSNASIPFMYPVLADMDGDGDVDVAIVENLEASAAPGSAVSGVYWFPNLMDAVGAGATAEQMFNPATTPGFPLFKDNDESGNLLSTPSEMGALDWNRDGRMDLVLSTRTSRRTYLLGNNGVGPGGFDAALAPVTVSDDFVDGLNDLTDLPTSPSVNPRQFEKLVVVDLDGEGVANDLLVSDQDTVWTVVSGAGAGAPGTVVDLGSFESMVKLAVADINSDGVIDVAFVEQTGRMGYLPGASNAAGVTFGSTVELASGTALSAGAFGDFDGDNDVDVLFGTFPNPVGAAVTWTLLESILAEVLVADSVTGDDAACATDPSVPCATVARALAVRGRPGQALALKLRGDLSLTEPLVLSASGLGRPLTVIGTPAAAGGAPAQIRCPAGSPAACIHIDADHTPSSASAAGASTASSFDVVFQDVVIDGAVSAAAVTVTNAAVRMERVTMSNHAGSAVAASKSTVSILSSTISSTGTSNAVAKGGAVYGIDSQITVDSTTISGSRAGQGGAIAVEASTVFTVFQAAITLSGSTSVTGCTALTGNGGAVVVSGATLVASSGVSFADNTAAAGNGGAVALVQSSRATFTGVTASGNTAPTGSGGTFAVDDLSSLELTSVTTTTSAAGAAGGTLYASRPLSITVNGLNVDGSTAGTNGGVIALVARDGDATALSGVTAVNCGAPTGNGGFLHWMPSTGASLALVGGSFGCTAPTGGGGGVFVQHPLDLVFSDPVFLSGASFAGSSAAYGDEQAGPPFSVGSTSAAAAAAAAAGSSSRRRLQSFTDFNVTVAADVPVVDPVVVLTVQDRFGQTVVTDGSTSCTLSSADPAALPNPGVYQAVAGVVSVAPVTVRGALGAVVPLGVVCGDLAPTPSGQAFVKNYTAVFVDGFQPPAFALPSSNTLFLPVVDPVPKVRVVDDAGEPGLFTDLRCRVSVSTTDPKGAALLPNTTTSVAPEYAPDPLTFNVTLSNLFIKAEPGALVVLTVVCRRDGLEGQTLPILSAPITMKIPESTDIESPPPVIESLVPFAAQLEIQDRATGGTRLEDDTHTVCEVRFEGEQPATLDSDPATAVAGLVDFPSITVVGDVGKTYNLTYHCALGDVAVPVPDIFPITVRPCIPGQGPNPARDTGSPPSGTVCEFCPVGTYSPDGTECVLCPPGTYGDQTGMQRCQACPFDTYREEPGATAKAQCEPCAGYIPSGLSVTLQEGSDTRAACVCDRGFYMATNPSPTADVGNPCLECPTGLNCTSTATLLSTAAVKPEFWRTSTTSADIRDCRLTEVCPGGAYALSSSTGGAVTSPEALCRDHHRGPLCELCEDGYGLNDNGDCKLCDNEAILTLKPAGRMLIAIATVVVVGIIVWRCYKSRRISLQEQIQDHDERMAERKRLARLDAISSKWIVKGKLLVAFMQVSSVITLSYDIEFPNIVDDVSDWFSWANLSVFSVVEVGCKATLLDQYDKLQVITILPMVLVGLFTIAYAILSIPRLPIKADVRPVALRFCFGTILFIMFLAYPVVASNLVKTFLCTDFDDGTSLLTADFSIDCNSSRYDSLLIYSLVMVFVFVLGIPVFYMYLLYNARRKIYPGNAGKVIVLEHRPGTSFLHVDASNLTPTDREMLRERVRVAAFRINERHRAIRNRFKTALSKASAAQPDDSPSTPTAGAGSGSGAGAGADAGADAGAAGAASPTSSTPNALLDKGQPKSEQTEEQQREAKAAQLLARVIAKRKAKASGLQGLTSDLIRRKKTAVGEVEIPDPAGGAVPKLYYVFNTRDDADVKILAHLAWEWHQLRYNEQEDMDARESTTDIFHLRFLYEDYKPKFWYFEVVELFRKFLLTSVSLLILPDSATQIVFAMLVTLIYAVMVLRMKPLAFPLDNTAMSIANWALFAQLYAGLLLKVEVDQTDNYDDGAMGVIIIMVILCVPVFIIIAAVMEVFGVFWEIYIFRHEDVDEWQLFLLPMLHRWGVVFGCAKPPNRITDMSALVGPSKPPADPPTFEFGQEEEEDDDNASDNDGTEQKQPSPSPRTLRSANSKRLAAAQSKGLVVASSPTRGNDKSQDRARMDDLMFAKAGATDDTVSPSHVTAAPSAPPAATAVAATSPASDEDPVSAV